MEKRYVVTDWSGVVSNDTRPVYSANMMLLSDHGKSEVTFEEWRRLSGMTPAGFLRNCGLTVDEQEVYDRYKVYFRKISESGVVPTIYPGVRETLDKLRGNGKKLVVLSSHPVANLRQEMERYGIEGFFEFVVGSALDKVSGLKEICDKLGLTPGRTPYVGDTIYDVQAAREARVLSVAVCYGYHTRERLEAEDPDILLGDFSLLPGVL